MNDSFDVIYGRVDGKGHGHRIDGMIVEKSNNEYGTCICDVANRRIAVTSIRSGKSEERASGGIEWVGKCYY